MSFIKTITRGMTNYENRHSFGSRLRAKRIAPLLRFIESAYQEHGCVNVIDIGGMERYWHIVPMEYLEQHKVSITIVNLPGAGLAEDHGPFRFVRADGCDLGEYADDSFHIAHSNSVVEHVGDWDRMVRYSKEIKRLAKRYFVQTPNYWFPIEPHCMTLFFHWLPKPVRVALVMRFSLGHWRKGESVDDAVRIVEGARLLDKKMFRQLFDDADIITERFLLLAKSFIAVRG